MELAVIVIIILFWMLRESLWMNKMEKKEAELMELAEDSVKEMELAVKQALKQSKATTRGQLTEHAVPLLEGFPYKFEDCKFSGAPFDYIVFDGMSEFRDGNKGKEITVVFADVKYGTSKRSAVQNAIRKAITAGRVRYEDFTVDSDNNLKIKE